MHLWCPQAGCTAGISSTSSVFTRVLAKIERQVILKNIANAKLMLLLQVQHCRSQSTGWYMVSSQLRQACSMLIPTAHLFGSKCIAEQHPQDSTCDGSNKLCSIWASFSLSKTYFPLRSMATAMECKDQLGCCNRQRRSKSPIQTEPYSRQQVL